MWKSNEDLLNYCKTGHTVSLDGHVPEAKPMLHSRSALLLGVKSPSLPAFTCDTSVDVALENKARRDAHAELLTRCPSAFHRRKGEDFPSSMVMHNQKMKDLLGDMHQEKDLGDIDRGRVNKYTFSIRREKDLKEKQELEERHFNSLPLLEDFVRPNSPVTPRQTGYEHGHIRSLMKLDTFGPSSSRVYSGSRESGRLPTPNVDRYLLVSPQHKLTMRSDVWSAGSSRTSTSHSTTTASLFSYRNDEQSTENPSNSMRSLFHSSSKLRSSNDLTIPTSLRGNSRDMTNRITKEDRLLLDPLVRRKNWHKSYTEHVQNMKDEENYRRKMKAHKKHQMHIASEERKIVRDFEKHLTLAKFES